MRAIQISSGKGNFMRDPVRIGNGEVSVEIAAHGAEMQSIVTSDGRSWLWNGDPAFWTGRSPVLFPIVGKAPNDTVSIEGKSYPMGQHGFARGSEFTLAEASPSHCRFELRAGEETRKSYPFEFLLMVEHRVEGRAVVVTGEVTNKDSRAMPFGFGFHPAFLWPLPGAEGKEHEIRLDNGAEPALIRLEGGLVTQDRLPSPFSKGRLGLGPDIFKQGAMLFPEGTGTGLRYGAADGPEIRFSWQNLPNLAFWTVPGAGYVCLEPWHGMAAEVGAGDALAARPYTQALEPGAVARFGFRAELLG
jgi:galactose mutarotase-like enzyme